MHLSAVSYLNTRPLVWGLMNGLDKDQLQLDFDLPSVCAQRLEQKQVDAGLVPVIEAARQHLTQIGSLGIACLGPVRSILLLSKVPIPEIRTLALDSSSRSSVMLARIVLEQNGLPKGRITRLLAYGESELLNPTDPLAPENRRLSILAKRYGKTPAH